MRPTVGVFLSLLLLSVPGCVTILGAPKRLIRVSSLPEGATLSLDGVEVGTTPCFLPVSEEHRGVLAFELAGHERAEVQIRQVTNGKIWMNLLWIAAGGVGAAVIHVSDNDAQWGDDLAIAGAATAAGMLTSFIVDSKSEKFHIHSSGPILVTLKKKDPR